MTRLFTRFHIVFFATFLALGGLMLLGGDVARPGQDPGHAGPGEVSEPDSLDSIGPGELAEKLVEGSEDFVVADWMARSFIPGSVRIANPDDAVARLIEATGGDTRLTVVLLAPESAETAEITETPDATLTIAAELQERGYRVQRVRGGVAAWQREVLDVQDDAAAPDASGDDDARRSRIARMRAISGFLQGRTGASNAPVPPPPVAVPVSPRPRSTTGDGGC